MGEARIVHGLLRGFTGLEKKVGGAGRCRTSDGRRGAARRAPLAFRHWWKEYQSFRPSSQRILMAAARSAIPNAEISRVLLDRGLIVPLSVQLLASREDFLLLLFPFGLNPCSWLGGDIFLARPGFRPNRIRFTLLFVGQPFVCPTPQTRLSGTMTGE